MIEILRPLHDCQVMSELGDTHLGYIVKRWKTIKLHLRSLCHYVGFQRSREVENIFLPRHNQSGRPVKSVWDMQYGKQVIDVHDMAYHLDQNNIHDIVGTDLNTINRFLAQHIPTSLDTESLEIRKQFHNFKLQLHSFVSSVPFWQSKSDIQLFWLEAATLCLP